MAQKRAIVTGASGYTGAHLVEHLLKEGWQVSVILREQSETTLLQNVLDKITICRYDGQIATMMAIFEEIGAVEQVFHLAACFLAEHKWQQVDDLLKANLIFGTHLLEAMAAVGCQSLINAGTVWQHYEQEAYNPVCLYAAMKEAFEKIVDYYVQVCGLRCVTLVFFDTYGTDDSRKKIMSLLKKCYATGELLEMSGGEQKLNFVHIQDVVRAYEQAAKLLATEKIGHEVYNVASPQAYSLKEIVEMMEMLTGSALNVKFGVHPYRNREMMEPYSGGKLLPGWQAEISIEEGLSQYLKSKAQDKLINNFAQDKCSS